MTTPVPSTTLPTIPDDIVDGVCANFNGMMIMFVASSAALLALIGVCHVMFNRVPSGSTPSWGRPYPIGIFLFSIALWNMLPSAVTFVMFHIATTNIFSLQTNASCILLTGIPIIPAYMTLMALVLLLVYDANKMKETMSDFVNPLSSTEKKVLVCGVTGRGMIFVDALEKEKDGRSKSKTVAVDYANRWKKFVEHNMRACGISTDIDECLFDSVDQGSSKFGLPFSSASFDRIVISPFLRNAFPIGDLTVGEDVKHRRMQCLLAEAIRVLKEGGEIICVDQAANAITIWADLRDAGLSPLVEECGVELGPSFFFRKKCLKIVAVKKCDVAIRRQELEDSGEAAAVELYETDDGGRKLLTNSAAVEDLPGVAPNVKYATICCYQFLFTVVLVVASLALYSPLSVPTNIPLSQRVNNIVVGIAVGYPMMAYFSRSVYVDTDASSFLSRSRSVPSLLCRLAALEMIALLASLLLSALFGIPTLVLQIALVSSSLSSDTRSYIGIGVSLALGLWSFSYGRKKATSGTIASRKIPAAYASYLS